MRELPQVGDKPPGGRADAIRNRRQLLSAAAEFVTQVGAEKVTMDGLASYSGLGRAHRRQSECTCSSHAEKSGRAVGVKFYRSDTAQSAKT
jgi:hypothetical protein